MPRTGITFAFTVIVQFAEKSPALAVMTAVPAFKVLTKPLETLAILLSELLQLMVLSLALSGETLASSWKVSPSVSSIALLLSLMLLTGTTLLASYSSGETTLISSGEPAGTFK